MSEQSEPGSPEDLERKRARAARRAAYPTRQNIDAALRRQLSMSPEIAEYVRGLDAELDPQRLPDSTVVTVALARGELPDAVESGTRVYEPSFTEAFLIHDGAELRGEVIVALRITADVPAAVRRHLKDAEIVVVGRGLEWVVDSAEELDGQLLLAGHTVGCRPQPLTEI